MSAIRSVLLKFCKFFVVNPNDGTLKIQNLPSGNLIDRKIRRRLLLGTIWGNPGCYFFNSHWHRYNRPEVFYEKLIRKKIATKAPAVKSCFSKLASLNSCYIEHLWTLTLFVWYIFHKYVSGNLSDKRCMTLIL